MQWIKAYQDHKVDLVGDLITEGRTFNIQMLFEYGIRSTYLQGIKDQSMTRHEYTSSSRFLSFRVPLHPTKNRIQGLNVTFLYRSPGDEDRDMLPPFAKISNRTKGVTWVYNPVVFCQPIIDEDVVWLSYWPIGDILDVGDEVHVNIFLDKKVLIVRECGASLVYIDDGEVEKEEKGESMKGKEVVGGDLSLFQVSKGGYYLCRVDFFESRTPDVLKRLFGDNIHHIDSRRWRPTSQPVSSVYQEVNAFRNPKSYKIEVELGVNFNSESETDKIGKAVSSLVGVETVSTRKEIGRLFVVGCINPQVVATCIREFEKMVQVLAYTYYGNG
ncbi:hypothetical protein L1987_54151 [Smallanthus sonchifolius]|uniref:Uncharacterized protein n=1 Tax=Smallanthus sonchifolius TaxID=185202 RepID=A0ACB9E622_9ASTR|nr:hypothetical protein L1987_54151 [Smallanthus sonchifolius]